jgi:gamma-glutamyl-gamma-aminobutyrate hydrolase PuuD
MRLVSVYYQDYHPFDTFGVFDKFITSSNPADLQPGDTIVVWGGQDIHPSFYGKKHSRMSQADLRPSKRDVIEWNMMQAARELGIPIIGVCRGAQMLCALAGGYLYQHVSGHGGNHEVKVKGSEKGYITNSLHHQMMVVPKTVDHELLAWTEGRSPIYHDEDDVHVPDEPAIEPEFVYFPKVKGFAVQWHPEMMSAFQPATAHIKKVFIEKTNV